jgi:NifU-like protein involved in Fe-S cluster formation
MFNSHFEKKIPEATDITSMFKTECGESFEYYLVIKNDQIIDISFTGNISQRLYISLDLTCSLVLNKSIQDILEIKKDTFFQKYPKEIKEEYQKNILEPLILLQFFLNK